MLNWKKVIGFMKNPGRTWTSIMTMLSPTIVPVGVSVAPRIMAIAATPKPIERIENEFAFANSKIERAGFRAAVCFACDFLSVATSLVFVVLLASCVLRTLPLQH